MEIIKGIKPDNEIEYIEELNIPKIEKQPLLIESLDSLSIMVDQKLYILRRRIIKKEIKVR